MTDAVTKIRGCIICEPSQLTDLVPACDPLLAFFALGCAATLANAGVVLCHPHHAQIGHAMRALGCERKVSAATTTTERPS